MIDHFGGDSSVPPELFAATEVGAGRTSAKKAKSMQWHAMSPTAPVPKSQKPRQLNGVYAGLYGRTGAGPRNKSQASVGGTGGVSAGRRTPCGQMGRSVQTCTAVTFP